MQKLDGKLKVVFLLFVPVLWLSGWALIWLDNQIKYVKTRHKPHAVNRPA